MIQLRPLAPEDRPALEDLLSQINEYYYGKPRAADVKAAIARELIEDGYCDTVLAWDGETAVGLAIYTFMQPTHADGGTLYLKELFVSSAARNHRLGRRLMAYLVEKAEARGCARLDWTAQRGNAATMRFYHSIGAQERPEKAYFRFEADAFKKVRERLLA